MESLITKLEIDRFEANKVKQIVEQEGRDTAEKADKVAIMKGEADRILEEALPTLKAAVDALNTLNRSDISEIKQNNNPHALVKYTLECVAILCEEK